MTRSASTTQADTMILKRAGRTQPFESSRRETALERSSLLSFASDLFDQAEECEDSAAGYQSRDEALSLRLRDRALELKERAYAMLRALGKEDRLV